MIGKQSWSYCPTQENPADCLTRGELTNNFKTNELWWNGPKWIKNKDQWPAWDRNITNITSLTAAVTE